MKVIANRFIPLPGFQAINLMGLVFVRRGAKVDDELLRHEAIHTCQMLETGFVGFYVWYLTEWLLRLAWRVLTLYRVQKKERRHHLHGAYAHLLFEREAYCHAAESDYLSRRRPYAWLIG